MPQLLITQLIVSSPTNWPVCRCLTIKLSIQAVTTVTNYDQSYNRHLDGHLS